MRVGLYARVSTTDQTCEMQLIELRAYARSRGLEVVGEYVDNGISGAKSSRPERNRLLDDARRRKLDLILVWKLDRWGPWMWAENNPCPPPLPYVIGFRHSQQGPAWRSVDLSRSLT